MTQITRFPRRSAAAALMLLTLAACGSRDKDKDQYVERPVDQIYNTAMDSLLERNYTEAAKQFDEVERQHPYSVWATKAQLMAAYAHYEADKYDDAIVALDRFIQLHPSNPDTPYAYYLKALCYYEQIADVGRDQRNTRQALRSLEELTKRYPNSAYARDARLKIDLTRDHLAGKEMSIGRFYLRQGQVLAAVNRFRIVVEQYQTTSHVPEALHRLVESYTTLGMTNDAIQVAAVLGYNYPGSEWYVDTYAIARGEQPPGADRPGFFGRMVAPPVTLGDNVDKSGENARRRAAEKAERDAQIAREREMERAAKEKAPPPPGGAAPAAAAPPPPVVTPGEARAVDTAPLGGETLSGARIGSTSLSAPVTTPSPAPAPAPSAPAGGGAYDQALANTLAEQQHARDSLAYWTSAAENADPTTKAMAEQNRAGAQKALEYWIGRERELRRGAAATGGSMVSTPSRSADSTPPAGTVTSGDTTGSSSAAPERSAAADENAKNDGGWLSRTWKSIF